VELHHEFDVPAPRAETLELLLDPVRAVACMPGAALVEVTPDGVWKTTLSVKLGPVTMEFLNDVRIVVHDAEAGVARLTISGRDRRGKGGAEATIEAAVTPTADGGTHVAMDTNVRFSGQAAQLGRPSVVDDVSRKLVSDFAAAIAEGLRHGVAPAQGPADGLGIARAALSGAISRQFRRFERPEGGSS